MSYATGLMEYSDDPLSDATPSFDDITAYVVGGVSWSDGRSRDLDDPQAGSITFRLRNQNGEWFPNSGDSLYPDSPFLLRRLRWSVNGTAEGVWYVTRWQPVYPAGTSYSEVDVTAVDGFELLSLDNLDLLDPPTASSYEEVVMHDQPFAFYHVSEAASGALVPVTGPEGLYKDTVTDGTTFQQPPLLLGDPHTSVNFNTGYARAPLGNEQPFSDHNAFTVEAWVFAGSAGAHAAGPLRTAIADSIFELATDGLNIYLTGGLETIGTDPGGAGVRHLVGTWNGLTASFYVNGALNETQNFPGESLQVENANDFIYVHASAGSSGAYVSKVAFYTYALSPERILAHYQAGAERGFGPTPGFNDYPAAGERIAAVADSPLWAETEIQDGEHIVRSVMEHGQSKLEEIRAAVKTEMPDNHFFFDGDGNPTYLPWNYKDGLGPLATFGPGGIGYESIEPVYDDEMFTEVTVGHEAAPGEETQHTETDTAAEAEFYRRAHAETGLILTDHQDAIAVAAAILERFRGPQQRYASLTINGNDTTARTQILARQIGDMIRVKGIGVNDSDIVTTILGKSKTLTAAGHLTCTWTLSRGFDAAAGNWQLGVAGFSELGETTVLA